MQSLDFSLWGFMSLKQGLGELVVEDSSSDLHKSSKVVYVYDPGFLMPEFSQLEKKTILLDTTRISSSLTLKHY